MRTLLAFVLVLGLAGCAHDVTLPAGGTIYGDLVYEDGHPAAGIVVVVEGTDLMDITDRDGRFVINEVLAVDEAGMGKYYNVRGYGIHEGTSMGFISMKFKVKGQQSYSIGTAKVLPTGTIIGAVYLSEEDDSSGVRIQIEGTSLETVTKVGGNYMLSGVPKHSGYSIRCSHPGFVTTVVDKVWQMGMQVPVQVMPGGLTNLGLSVLDKQL